VSEACVLAHAAAEAAWALRAAGGRKLVLLSAEGAAGFLGPRGWRALVTRAAALAPEVPFEELLCCAGAPGHALSALRAGCRGLVLDGACIGYPAVAAAAAECGARLLPARPPALDLGGLDLRRPGAAALLARWLTRTPHDREAPGG
jgi:hypothetical protein